MRKIFLSALVLTVLVPVATFAATDPNPLLDGSRTSAPLGSSLTQTPSSAQSAPDLTSACSTLASNGLRGVVACIKGVINQLVILIISISVITVMWGAFTMLSSEEKRASGRQTVIYGIIGLFVMTSIWGFVNILDSTFRLSAQGPITPTLLRQ